MSNKAYNFAIVPVAAAVKSTTSTGKNQIKFRGTLTMRGREIERTVVAQGAAADLIKGMIKKGKSVDLRCVINRAPANEDGTKGGEYLSVVALPKAA